MSHSKAGLTLAVLPIMVTAGLFAGCTTSASSPTSTSGAAAITTAKTEVIPTEPSTIPASRIVSSSTTDQTVGMPKSSLDESAIPLGTGSYSTTTAKTGSEYECHPRAGGAPVTMPPWVNTTAKTWNATVKVAVEGHVTWKSQFAVTHSGVTVTLAGNGLPPLSGTFPVPASDPAHVYNPDPTPIAESAKAFTVSVPYSPKQNATPECLNGTSGVMADGILLLDAMDGGGNDAAAVETQDTCHGHANNDVGYHYHGLSPCLLSTTALSHTTQVGWALDGYGLYVEYDSKGQLLKDSSLDVCHGRKSVVLWHGKMVDIYHYDMTTEYPYAVGCFRGTAATLNLP